MPLRGTQNALSVVTAEKRRQAVQMAIAGESWDDIAATVGYASRGAAYTEVERALIEARGLLYEDVETFRMQSILRLMAQIKELWPGRADEKVSMAILRLSERLDKLTGADVPVQVELGEGQLDRLLRDAEAEVGRRTIAAQVEASASPRTDDPEG